MTILKLPGASIEVRGFKQTVAASVKLMVIDDVRRDVITTMSLTPEQAVELAGYLVEEARKTE